MLKFYESAPTLSKEQDQFDRDIKDFTEGLIDPVKFKAIRVAHGVYEQRQLDTYMIRIRCAAGGITPLQLRRTAELAEQYGSGEVHFTTRQEVQVHDVLIQNVLNVIRGLAEVGLSSRGGGGNTIRNILTPADSGIAHDEAFDVDPYAIALTTRMINEEDSWVLPRKFKIALSSSTKDTAFTQATDLGFVANIKDGKKGFEVYCAGGMGAKPMVGHELIDWIDESQVYHVTRAIKTMFDKNGNRRSKFSNRIKFLWKKLDKEEFLRLFYLEYDKIKDDASLALVLSNIPNEANENINLKALKVDSKDYDKWKTRFVSEQKQKGLFTIILPLRLGDFLKPDIDKLCDVLDHIGENTIRCDRNQNARLRNIPEAYLGNIYQAIKDMDMTLADYAPFISNMINCTGAQTCKLGVCLPRGLSDAITDKLSSTSLNLDEISNFKLNMSGCPNTCGMHHVADLGFFGKIGRKEGEIYPAYNVLAGAKLGKSGQTEYAERVSEISSKHIPNFVEEFLGDWIPKKAIYKDNYQDYLEKEGKALITSLCAKYNEQVPTLGENENHYHDWGRDRRMMLDDMGSAECSAGLFDMIDVDKKVILSLIKSLPETTEKSDVLYKMVYHASRMLLITRGLDAKTEEQAIELFAKHFVQTELINSKYQDVLSLAKLKVLSELTKHEDVIVELGNEVIKLYANMDDSLKFKTENSDASKISDTQKKDFRGVTCPMNFVKTKLVLETMNSGEKLEILLDNGEPIENVPLSVQQEGHKILKKEKTENHWTVLIQKK